MTKLSDLFDFEKVYDEDGKCRLCGSDQYDDHAPKCPGVLLDLGYWNFRLSFSYGGCGRGCCPWQHDTMFSQDMTDLAGRFVKFTDGERLGPIDLGLSFTKSMDLDDDFNQETKRIRKAIQDAEEAKERETERKEQREAYERSMEALETEKADLRPEAYERRLNELKETYKDVL